MGMVRANMKSEMQVSQEAFDIITEGCNREEYLGVEYFYSKGVLVGVINHHVGLYFIRKHIAL